MRRLPDHSIITICSNSTLRRNTLLAVDCQQILSPTQRSSFGVANLCFRGKAQAVFSFETKYLHLIGATPRPFS